MVRNTSKINELESPFISMCVFVCGGQRKRERERGGNERGGEENEENPKEW